jgi:hypothetical protein
MTKKEAKRALCPGHQNLEHPRLDILSGAVLCHHGTRFALSLANERRLITRRFGYSPKDSVMPAECIIPKPVDARGPTGDLQAKLFRKIGISAVVAALEAAKPLGGRKDLSGTVKDLAA